MTKLYLFFQPLIFILLGVLKIIAGAIALTWVLELLGVNLIGETLRYSAMFWILGGSSGAYWVSVLILKLFKRWRDLDEQVNKEVDDILASYDPYQKQPPSRPKTKEGKQPPPRPKSNSGSATNLR